MDEILRRISHGETLTRACASNPDYPAPSTVIDWVHSNRNNLAERYARARDRQIEAWADEILDVADGAIAKPETAHAVRVAVDSRKFLLSKLKPEVYGDRARVELTGADGKDLATSSLDWLRKVLTEPAAKATPLLEHQQEDPPASTPPIAISSLVPTQTDAAPVPAESADFDPAIDGMVPRDQLPSAMRKPVRVLTAPPAGTGRRW